MIPVETLFGLFSFSFLFWWSLAGMGMIFDWRRAIDIGQSGTMVTCLLAAAVGMVAISFHIFGVELVKM